jgi:hypothetical protein
MPRSNHIVVTALVLSLVSATACDNDRAPLPLTDPPAEKRPPTALTVEPGAPALAARTPKTGRPTVPFSVSIVLPPIPTFPAAPSAAPPPPTPPPAPAPAERRETSRVIVYGADWCAPCRQLQSSLRSRGVPFVFINMDDKNAMSSAEGRLISEMPPAMRNGIPATRVVQPSKQTKWVGGNDPDGVERAYRGT